MSLTYAIWRIKGDRQKLHDAINMVDISSTMKQQSLVHPQVHPQMRIQLHPQWYEVQINADRVRCIKQLLQTYDDMPVIYKEMIETLSTMIHCMNRNEYGPLLVWYTYIKWQTVQSVWETTDIWARLGQCTVQQLKFNHREDPIPMMIITMCNHMVECVKHSPIDISQYNILQNYIDNVADYIIQKADESLTK